MGWSTLDEHTEFEQDTAAFTRDCLARPAEAQAQRGSGSLCPPPERSCGLLDLSEWQELLVIALGNVNHELLGAFRELPREESWKKNSMPISHGVPLCTGTKTGSVTG